jgi:ribosomal protein L7Ae-like RNA K-turn-binding protein
VDATVERKLLGLLGLGVRGRLVLVGVDRVREAAHRGVLRVAVVARDASANSRGKVDRLLAAKKVPTVIVPSATALGEVAGRDSTTVMGVVDAHLAKGILALVSTTDAVQSGSGRKG